LDFKGAALRRYVSLLLSILILTAILFVVRPENLLSDMSRFPLDILSGAFALVIVNQLTVVHRYRRILNHFGFEIPWGPIFRASSLGNLAALVIIPLMGHMIGRQAVLRRAGVSPVENAMIVAYERILVALVSAAMAVWGGLYLLGQGVFGQMANIPFVEILLVLSVAWVLNWRLGWRAFERQHLAAVFTWHNAGRILELLLVTVVSLGAMLACFVLLFHVVAPGVGWLELVAMAAIVSFGASIPVSFGGWGLREVAAVYVLGLAGVAADVALSASIFVGLLSIAGVLVLAGAVVLLTRTMLLRVSDVAVGHPSGMVEHASSFSTENVSAWLLYMATAVLIFFQIHVSVSGTIVNLNLADPFAVLALSAVAMDALSRRQWPRWTVPGFNTCLLMMGGVFLLSLGWAWWLRGNVSGWAIGKVIGWVVLSGYLAAGYLAVHYYHRLGFRRLVEIMVSVLCVAVVCAVVLAPMRSFDIPGFVQLQTSGLEGYSGNRNALAFQLLVVMAVYLPLLGRVRCAYRSGKGTSWLHILALGVLMGGLFLTASRSALIAFSLMVCTALALRVVGRQMIVTGLLVGVGFWWLVGAMPMLWHGLLHLVGLVGLSDRLDMLSRGRFSTEVSDAGRLEMLLAAVNAWWHHPIFGGGLGSFLQDSTGSLGLEMIIHNTLLWLMAEVGLVGVAPFVITFVLIIRSAWGRRQSDTVRAYAMLLLMLVFAVMSQFHEVLYQRIFWLGLGAVAGEFSLSRRLSIPLRRCGFQ
jgi:hypothetical protein